MASTLDVTRNVQAALTRFAPRAAGAAHRHRRLPARRGFIDAATDNLRAHAADRDRVLAVLLIGCVPVLLARRRGRRWSSCRSRSPTAVGGARPVRRDDEPSRGARAWSARLSLVIDDAVRDTRGDRSHGQVGRASRSDGCADWRRSSARRARRCAARRSTPRSIVALAVAPVFFVPGSRWRVRRPAGRSQYLVGSGSGDAASRCWSCPALASLLAARDSGLQAREGLADPSGLVHRGYDRLGDAGRARGRGRPS